MGIVHRGIPRRRALELKAEYNLRYFVETGSLVGNTAAWAGQHFQTVQSIEVDKLYFLQSRDRCAGMKNVVFYNGDSAVYLSAILESLPGPALIWLDAHWSPDLRGDRPETVCPVLEEVKQITEDGRDHVVLIDDARLFGSDGWPTIRQIASVFGKHWFYRVREDVIEFVPLQRGMV